MLPTSMPRTISFGRRRARARIPVSRRREVGPGWTRPPRRRQSRAAAATSTKWLSVSIGARGQPREPAVRPRCGRRYGDRQVFGAKRARAGTDDGANLRLRGHAKRCGDLGQLLGFDGVQLVIPAYQEGHQGRGAALRGGDHKGLYGPSDVLAELLGQVGDGLASAYRPDEGPRSGPGRRPPGPSPPPSRRWRRSRCPRRRRWRPLPSRRAHGTRGRRCRRCTGVRLDRTELEAAAAEDARVGLVHRLGRSRRGDASSAWKE